MCRAEPVAEFVGELLERKQHVHVRVRDRLARRHERHGVLAGDRLRLRHVEYRNGAEDRAHVLLVISRLPRRSRDRRRRENADGFLALAYAAVQAEEGAEASYERGVGSLQRYQKLV
jgi:hypothetical protein